MEDWKLDFEWLRVQHFVKETLGRNDLPGLNSILFLIGIQELGRVNDSFTKEEKQDLMHIAVCVLLSDEGYFEFEGMDGDGWPHFKQVKALDITGSKSQEKLLKEKIIGYFAKDVAEELNEQQ